MIRQLISRGPTHIKHMISLPVSKSIRFYFSRDEASASVTSSQQQYMVFPTKFPIFPYYVYSTRINKQMYEYIKKNNIRYVSAFPLRPGVFKKKFVPTSLEHMEEFLRLKPTQANTAKKIDSQRDTIEINNNNIIFDGPTSPQEQVPVSYVNDIDQVFPVGSVCRIAATLINKSEYVAHLRSQIRMKINPDNYRRNDDLLIPIMYLSGQKIKNENLLDIQSDFQALIQLYHKLEKISKLNLPDVGLSSATKTIQLLSGYLCTLQYFTPLQLYDLFQMTFLPEKSKLLLRYYKEYINSLQKEWEHFREKNQQQVNEQIHKETLRNVYEHMQKMLGQGGENKYVNKIKRKLAQGKYPQHVRQAIECELQNMLDLGDGNPQINKKKQFSLNIFRHYINLLIQYPFGVKTKEQLDIENAKKILQEDHYGMKKVKQRILEFMAVSKLKGQFKSKVLLLYGPPGVGKTSIVKSIAKCLNRPYGRISLGGEYDTSIMRGHRKTYVGAYPGKIFDTIHKAKAQNPVILLDEIDKIQSRAGGASLQDVVMEVLDPIQNTRFKDDYVDLQIDLSNVLFICTANSLETIFPPLLDRFERIEVTGYTTHEKEQIFKRYIVKNSIQGAGIPEDVQKQIDFTHQATTAMIQGYCKEAGVRNLVRKTNKIFQKMALQYVKGEAFSRTIQKQQLKDYLGLPKFFDSRLFPGVPPSGVMIGLAYNAYGGSIMYIETAATNLIKNKTTEENKDKEKQKSEENVQGSFMVTGNIHDVMKESCQLAFTYAKYICATFFSNHFLEKNDIHLNFPEIEIGKDGPSAGCAITSALISLALNKPMKHEIGMTGQITLSGKVGAIGGVKQKTMGAKRQGIKNLIFPLDNKRDVEELEDQIKEGMRFQFAESYFQVLNLVFGLKVEVNKE